MPLLVDTHIAADRWTQVLPDVTQTLDATCGAVLDHLAVAESAAAFEISILLGDDACLKSLNGAHRGKDRATNVLSFPTYEPGEWKGHINEGYPVLLGDLALSLDTLEREAAGKGIAAAAHLTHLTVHGVLHLLGYDHESESAAQQMEQIERDICARLGLSDPYGDDV
ncbi:MAG: rRNA maturation RNase YbeY [Pseudomonadota bacterium]